MILYPVNLNITDKACLVIGGGNVAFRKIRSLLDCHARVTVISPQVSDEIEVLSERGDISLLLREYKPGDLAGAFLVFAATDNPNVQSMINHEASEHNILLNSVDAPERCDFQVPAKVRRGDMLMTISTGGASPALAKLIRERLEAQFTDEYGRVVALFAAIRKVVVTGSADSAENKRLFQKMLESDVIDLVCKDEWERVAELLEKLLPNEIDVERLLKNIDSKGSGQLAEA